MIKFYMPALLELSKEIGRITQATATTKAVQTESTRKANSEIMRRHGRIFTSLGLKMCEILADRIVKRLEDEQFTGEEWNTLLYELQSRMQDECSVRHFLVLSDEEKAVFEPTSPLFGAHVEDKLPGVIEDIAEAGKCLGLGRATATVFHLMRVMETGVQKFGEKLGVELADEKVWQVILDQLNAKIKKLGKGGQHYASISAHLYSVKLAWRNEVMHPKATYTVEEATDIFAAVRRYMVELITAL